MNLKVKAAAIMAGIFAGTIAVQAIMGLVLDAYGAQAVINTFGVGILLFLIYWMYDMILASLERDEKINSLTKKD
jgi:divalent metal cation (Fe/Co/Zn/Cd) transporter